LKKVIHILNNPDLFCDTCGYTLPKIGLNPAYIGFPCPKCGANMCTQAAYDTMKYTMKIVDFINLLFGWMGTETPNEKAAVSKCVRVKTNPKGDLIIK